MTGQWGMDEAHDMLMSPTPYSQASAAALIRNFASAATLMAQSLRATASHGEGAGDAGAAMATQSEAHAEWFDQVAANANHAATQLDTLAQNGQTYQADGKTIYTQVNQSIARDSADTSGASDMHQIRMQQFGSRQLSMYVNDWGADYSSFKAPAPPPVPSGSGGTYGGGGGGTSGGGSGSAPTASGAPPAAVHSGGSRGGEAILIPAGGGAAYGGGSKGGGTIDRGPGVPGSVEVGPEGGDFAGWYKDPRTGYYVDPQTGREYDPVTQRWIDPVTGQPFGEVAKYATGLQGLGPEATTGGLLSDGAGGLALGGGAGGGAGSAGGFAGLLGSGDAIGVAAGYGGALPPSLANGSAASSALWAQAARSLGVKSAVASELLGREQAARAGRPYMPSTQAQAGQGGGSTRTRPAYLTADEEEASLFSSGARRASSGAGAEEEALAARSGRAARAGTVAEEEAQGSAAGRRSYLPPSQATGKDEKDGKRRARPDWLTDAFGVAGAPGGAGVLGE